MKKIFVTGASGFVGSNLVEVAFNMGFELHAAVRKSSKVENIKPFISRFVYQDLSDTKSLADLFIQEQYDYIIHAAALTKAKTAEEMEKVNVGYTESILSAAFTAGTNIKRVVFVSSLAAIGPISYTASQNIHEDSPYQPLTVYGRSKQKAEQMIIQKFGDKSISVFRPTAVYGPRERDLFILFDTLNKGLDPYIGNKPQKLSFIYVKDLVEVLLQGCVKEQDGLQFYNLSDGEIYSKYQLADIFKQTFAKKPLRMHIPYRIVALVAKISQRMYKNSSKTPVIYPERLSELTAENWACDISKARNILGFDPKYTLNTGLKETLEWYKTNKWL